MMKEKIRELLEKGKSGSEIAKIIHKRKKDTLAIIRDIKRIKKKKESVKYIPKKYRKPKQKKRIEKIKKKKEKKIKKEIIKKEKKEKLREIKKRYPKCNFNYITQHHIGYKFYKKVNIPIIYGMSQAEIDNIIKYIEDILEKLHDKVKCSQRMNYFSLEYVLILDTGQKEKSKISSNISDGQGIVSFKRMLYQIEEIVMYLINLVEQAQSPKEIIIKKVIYVNYDFKSSFKE